MLPRPNYIYLLGLSSQEEHRENNARNQQLDTFANTSIPTPRTPDTILRVRRDRPSMSWRIWFLQSPRRGTWLEKDTWVSVVVERGTYLPIYLPTYIPTYLYTYLPIYLPTYLYTYIPTYLPFKSQLSGSRTKCTTRLNISLHLGKALAWEKTEVSDNCPK